MVETRSKRKDNPKDKKEGGDKRPKLVTPRDRPKIAFKRPPKATVSTAAPLPSTVEAPPASTVEENITARETEKPPTETEIIEETMPPINVLVNAAATIEANLAVEEEDFVEPDGANEEEDNRADEIGEKGNESEKTESDNYQDAVEDGAEAVDSERTVSDKNRADSSEEAEETTANKEASASNEENIVEEEDRVEEEVGEASDGEEEAQELEEGEEETELGADNLDEEVSEPEEAIKPARMYFSASEYHKQIKLSTRCFILEAVKTLETLKPKLTNAERLWFEEHPQFRHFFHMKIEKSHKVQGMWMLLQRTCEIERDREVWFIVNGVPIRYGLREHALLSGLNCCNYPVGYEELGSTRFVERLFKKKDGQFGKKQDGQLELMRLEDVKAKLLKMGASRDRLKMAVLYFLGSVICARTKSGVGALNVFEFLQRAVDDLELCKTFPWGRYSYDYMLKEISHTMNHFGGVVKEKTTWPLPGFCIPLEILAFDAIPKLGRRFREPVVGADALCPRMCRWSFKPNGMRGMPLSDIYQELGNEVTEIHSIIPTLSVEEETLLEELYEADDDVDKVDIAVESWEKRLDKGLPVFFEDMFEEDVAARSKPPEPVEEGEEVPEPTHEAGGEGSKMMKMMKKMLKQLGRVEKKVDSFETRLDSVEDFVKEVQKGKKKK